MFPRFLFFLLLFLNINVYSQSLNWSQFIDSTLTFSSPRAVDLNMDGVLDIVIGSGIDSVYTNHGIIALDGVNGNLLWSVPTVNDIFTSSVFNDINGDSIPDIYIGGRDAQFYCINGLDGSIIWQFLAPPNLINNSDSGYYNFYSPQLLEDVNNDGVKDILVSNGGNHSLLPWIGKIYYDLKEHIYNNKIINYLIISIEHLYPFPLTEIELVLKKYNKIKKFYLVQEEPENMGAGSFILDKLNFLDIQFLSRSASCVTASGSKEKSNLEQNEIIDKLFN